MAPAERAAGQVAAAFAAILVAATAAAQAPGRGAAATEAVAEKREPESPWLVVPTFSSSPKLGTSLGALAGYLHYFDENSQVSMFGVTGQYTSTGSTVASAFGKASFGEDHHRLIAGLVGGNIKNDYENFLGTGRPLKSEDQLRAAFTRYLYRVKDDWFVGAQAVYTDYTTFGQSPIDEQVLNVLGLTGFKSAGVGLAAVHDSRDLEAAPRRGWFLNVNNVAYRESLGGEENFDVYRTDYRGFWSHGSGNVLAVRQSNHWTSGAPSAAYASVQLRGYKMGEFLGKHMSSLEAEERLRLAEKWTATFFTGIACLYGGGKDCSDGENLFPNLGLGVQYVLKRREGIVLNLEYGAGEGGTYGVYLKMGYAY